MHCQQILLIVDPGMCRTPAFDRAVHLACRSGAALHLLMVDYLGSVEAVGLINAEVMNLARRAHLAEREEWLRELALDLQSRHLRVSCQVLWGRPSHEKIIAKVLAMQPDLVIKDLAITQGLRRLLLNPVDWQLLRLCPAPLLLVRQAAHAPSHRILAAVDPAHEAEPDAALNQRIVDAAQWLCTMEPAQLHLLHAYGGVPPLPVLDSTAATDLFNEAYAQLRQVRQEKFKALAQGRDLSAEQLHLLDELPQEAIVHCSHELKADTLVLGTVQRSGLGRLLMGSTAERVLSQLDCDVLAIKPQAFIADLQAQLRGEGGAPA